MNAIAAVYTARAERRSAADIARELGAIFARRADESTNEDKFVADKFALLKSSGLMEARRAGGTRRRRRQRRRACDDVADARLSLRLGS